jgi:HAD superfamily phosphoserine phosphatase-like hydrolase
MKKKFPLLVFDKLKMALDTTPNPYAVFDADGTLWNTDLGETFFKYQIKNNLLDHLPADPWQHYREQKSKEDPRPAYLWLAQINSGHEIEKVKTWAENSVKEISPLPIYPEILDILEFFNVNKVKIYVVTASVKWAVEPGAKHLGIPENQVLGIATKIKNGVITKEQDGVITYRIGKADAILKATGGEKPIFACGNTLGDASLLEISSHVSLAVRSAQPGEELFLPEKKLLDMAIEKGWMNFKYE